MKRKSLIAVFILIAASVTFREFAHADSTPANPSALTPEPWEKFSLTAGGFFSRSSSNVRIGSGIGIDLDLEDGLGLDATSNVFRIESFWRFTRSRRHRLDATWFGYRRSADRKVGEDFNIQDSNGNTVTVQAGSDVATKFNLDIIEGAYSYSFFQDDRLDFAAAFGMYVMPIDFSLKATGLSDASGSFSFTAPLPVAGLRFDVSITPKWFLRTGTQLFYLEYEGFKGQVHQSRAAIEFLPVRHVGIGVGVDTMRIAMEARGEDYARVDLRGNVEFQYTGIQLYAKTYF